MSFPLSERVLQSGYLDDLGGQSADTIRARCRECEDAESAISFARRVLQGRLDIIDTELSGRVGGAPTGVGGLSGIVDSLPKILADGGHGRASGTGHGRRPFDLPVDIEAVSSELLEAVDAIAGVSVMTSLTTLPEAEVKAVAARLRDLEHEFSRTRRELHHRIDTLRSELSGRYERGELTVDELLG